VPADALKRRQGTDPPTPLNQRALFFSTVDDNSREPVTPPLSVTESGAGAPSNTSRRGTIMTGEAPYDPLVHPAKYPYPLATLKGGPPVW
jgi:hypothetical protein